MFEGYPTRAVERAMKLQEVILRAVSGQITWMQAAEIIGISARAMRRWRARYEEFGYDGLFDRRLKRPSPKRVPLETVEKVLCLYREQYRDCNVAHYVDKLQEVHGVDLSYTWVKTALQTAGLVAPQRKRGPHRKRRPRRPLPGMLLHCDGSRHGWLPVAGTQDLVVILDDATSEVYWAELVAEEDTASVLRGLQAVVESRGVFCTFYTDRASHFVRTPHAGGPPDRSRLTQVGRALEDLGVEHIVAYSPQARGRSERLFGTWQGRLPQELRLAGIRTLEQANRFLQQHWIGFHNRRFAVSAAQSGSAFLPTLRADLPRIFSWQYERVVGRDNTVAFARRQLQIQRQKFRWSLAGCRVQVCRHLDQTITLYYGPHQLGRYDSQGQPLDTCRHNPEAA